MGIVDENNIRRLDGTLLLVFRELLRQKRALGAAERLGLSQSGVSHALARLRDVFGDPLFLRRPYGLEPTRRALDLAPRIDALIAMAQEAVSGGANYDPARSTREFHIAAIEFMIPLLAAPLLKALEAEAPNSSVVFRHLVGQDALTALDRGEIDLMVGSAGTLPEGIVAEPLLAVHYAVVGREGHPAFAAELDIATYARLGHVVVASDVNPRSIPQAVLTPMGVKRRVVAVVPRYLTGFAMVAATDAVLIAPTPLAAHYARGFTLQFAPLPFDLAPLHVFVARKAAKVDDPGIDWLRGLVAVPGARPA